MSRVGIALVEMLVSLTLLGVLLAVVSGISLREQRFLRDAGEGLAASARMREARALLPLDVRGLSAADIVASQARDTALEFRATIGRAVVCDTTSGETVLAPTTADSMSYASFVRDPQSGDTVWMLTRRADSVSWAPLVVDSARLGPAGRCAGPLASIASTSTRRWRLRFVGVAGAAAGPGTVLRVTRPLRYSTYHASDGAWYFGIREWNPAFARFDPVQPVAGPLATGAAGFRIQYYDAGGTELAPGTADIARASVVRFTVHALSRARREQWRDLPQLAISDSGVATVRLRNAP